MPKSKFYEFLDHTADVGIIVSGETKERLFENAGRALFEIILGKEKFGVEFEEQIEVSGDDLEILMVNLLSELNIKFELEKKVLSKFEISFLDDLKILAKISGESYDAKRHSILTEIKAVTFHQIYVRKEGDVWRSQIIFDT